MSDSDSSSSSDKDFGLPKDGIANPAQKFCFFLTESGHSLNFVLLADNMADSEVTETTKLIQLHMGTISTSKKDVSSHSAVLVTDETTSWDYCGDVFKLSYINDCIEAGKILNIAPYLKDVPSKLYVENFDYMNVIYHRKYSWETIPLIYKLPKLAEYHPETSREDPNNSDSSVDSLCSFSSSYSVTYPRNSKRTKQQYTIEEKEAMLRYVVERKLYRRVKGKQIYKEMEAANICPIRTWQSMKDHFLRYLPKEIPRFSFLTAHQKKALQEGLFPYK